MSEERKCSACGKKKAVSEMKTCMHNQMHRYVCDTKCMNDFYNPPKKVIAQPAEAEGTGALDELLALFPLKIEKQAFVINGGAPLTADGDDEFLSFKKVDAALGEIRRLAEQGRAARSAVTAERDRLREALSFACKALCQVTSSDGSGHADIALSVFRLAGVGADEREALVEVWKANVKWRADAAMAASTNKESKL